MPPSDVAHFDGPRPSLADVTAILDSTVLRVVRAARAATTPVRDVVVLDTSDPRSVRAGTIVLGVGLSSSLGDAAVWVDRAGRAGAAAVVLKVDGDVDPEILSIAEGVGLALIAVPHELPWGQAYSLLRTSMISAGAGERADAEGVPVGDLFALADAVAAAVGGAVTIEDPQWRVLAFSNLSQPVDEVRRQTILGRAVPDDWRKRLEEDGTARALRTGRGVVRFDAPEPGFLPRMGVPIRAGGEVLGVIWVAEGEVPFDASAARALERSADLAALHVARHRASEDTDRRSRGALVREILEGRTVADAHRTALRASAPYTVVALEVVPGERIARSVDPERVLSVVSLFCEDAHRDAMCALVDDRFWGLIPTPSTDSRQRFLTLARRIVDRVELAVGVPLRVGIGFPALELADVPRSRQSAEQVLGVLARRGDGERVAHIEDVQVDAVLLEVLAVGRDRPELLRGRLQTLIDHDAELGTSHVDTLRAYLDAWGDIAETARRLDLHANTVRYRVRRLEELSGLDLRDPNVRFVTDLQLRLHAHMRKLS